MPKTVSAREAKNRFGSMMEWATENQDEVIVEVYGEPKVVVMPYTEFERVTQLREEARRRDILARLEALRAQVQARNQDLTEAEAGRIAQEIRDEALARLVQSRSDEDR
jgi:prevent-host-death family protein